MDDPSLLATQTAATVEAPFSQTRETNPTADITTTSTTTIADEKTTTTTTNPQSAHVEIEGKPTSLTSLRQNRTSSSSLHQASPDLESPIDSGESHPKPLTLRCGLLSSSSRELFFLQF